MKKTIAILLMLIMAFAFSCTALATEAMIIIEEVSGEIGETVEVPVSIKNNPGFASMDLKIEYDKDALELTDIKIGLFPASNMSSVSSGKISGGDSKDVTGDGVIFTAYFKIKDTAKNGKNAVSVEIYECYNMNDDEIKINVVTGGVTVNVPCQHTDTKVINAKEATCCEKGYTGDTYCNECETVIAKGKETAKDPSNHVGGTEVKGVKEATCSEKGYTGDTYCKGCGAVTAKGSEIVKDSSNHVGGTEVKNAKEATCSEKGYTGDTCCKGCGAVVAKGSETAKDADNHVGGTEVKNAKEATCTEKGYTGDTHCKDCGVKLESGKETDVLAHKGGKATCTEKAVCDSCGNEYGEADADAHKLHYETITAPTCTEKGEREITCENGCGYKANEEIDALGHDWGEWETVKEATYEEKGLKERKCEREGCNEKESAEIAVLVKPADSDENSKPNPGVTIVDSKDEGESNPNTGAPVFVTAAIVAVLAVARSKKRK